MDVSGFIVELSLEFFYPQYIYKIGVTAATFLLWTMRLLFGLGFVGVGVTSILSFDRFILGGILNPFWWDSCLVGIRLMFVARMRIGSL